MQKVRLLAAGIGHSCAAIHHRIYQSMKTHLSTVKYKIPVPPQLFYFWDPDGDRCLLSGGVDYVHANALEVADGQLTGRVVGPARATKVLLSGPCLYPDPKRGKAR